MDGDLFDRLRFHIAMRTLVQIGRIESFRSAECFDHLLQSIGLSDDLQTQIHEKFERFTQLTTGTRRTFTSGE